MPLRQAAWQKSLKPPSTRYNFLATYLPHGDIFHENEGWRTSFEESYWWARGRVVSTTAMPVSSRVRTDLGAAV
jgi:hypothetical protein